MFRYVIYHVPLRCSVFRCYGAFSRHFETKLFVVLVASLKLVAGCKLTKVLLVTVQFEEHRWVVTEFCLHEPVPCEHPVG